MKRLFSRKQTIVDPFSNGAVPSNLLIGSFQFLDRTGKELCSSTVCTGNTIVLTIKGCEGGDYVVKITPSSNVYDHEVSK